MVDLRETKNESSASRPKSNTFVSKAVYWILSTLLIIVLIHIIFLGVGIFVADGGFKTHTIVGFVIGIIGAVMLLIAIRNPLALWGQVMKKEADDPEKEPGNPLAATLTAGLLGLSLFIGGFVYGYTAEVKYLIMSFAIPAVLIRLFFKPAK